MKELDRYTIQIAQLKNQTYEYKFDGDDAFFSCFENSMINRGTFQSSLKLIKSESMLRLNFEIQAEVELTCDRSNETFLYPSIIEFAQLIKFGEIEEEISEDLKVIPKGSAEINIADIIYEAIILNIPMKKLHPKFQDNETMDDELIYSSKDIEGQKESGDPRWDALKKLKT